MKPAKCAVVTLHLNSRYIWEVIKCFGIFHTMTFWKKKLHHSIHWAKHCSPNFICFRRGCGRYYHTIVILLRRFVRICACSMLVVMLNTHRDTVILRWWELRQPSFWNSPTDLSSFAAYFLFLTTTTKKKKTVSCVCTILFENSYDRLSIKSKSRFWIQTDQISIDSKIALVASCGKATLTCARPFILECIILPHTDFKFLNMKLLEFAFNISI